MNKKLRLALAATVTAAMLSQTATSIAATESARDFLTQFTDQISVGRYGEAQEHLALVGAVCPGFDGLLLGNGNLVSADSLGNVFAAMENGARTPGEIVSALRAVLDTSSSINFLCNDVEVGPVNLANASSFPVGSAG